MSEQFADLTSEGELVECAWSPSLAADPFDVVVLDLVGSVSTLLDMIGRLRATLRPGVAFVGILPAAVDPVTRIYLSAVVDALVVEPADGASLGGASLVDAVRDALAACQDTDGVAGPAASVAPTRH